MFEIARQVRDLSLTDLKTKLQSRLSEDPDKLEMVTNVAYDKIKRQDLLHLLARFAYELESSLNLPTGVGFAVYVDRSRDYRTFDIEHLLTDSVEKVNASLESSGKDRFTSKSDFDSVRNNIGGLILLPRGRNRSMKDMVYPEKVTRYSSENILAQTLTESFFLNQPNWTKFSEESGISIGPIKTIDRDGIETRAKFYLDLARRIWSGAELERRFN